MLTLKYILKSIKLRAAYPRSWDRRFFLSEEFNCPNVDKNIKDKDTKKDKSKD